MALWLCLGLQCSKMQGNGLQLLMSVINSHIALQVQSLLLQLAKDPSQDVVDTAFEQLLPALLHCMADTHLLYTSLLPAILIDIRASVERYQC